MERRVTVWNTMFIVLLIAAFFVHLVYNKRLTKLFLSLWVRGSHTFLMKVIAKPTKARCMSSDPAKRECGIDCSKERGTMSRYVLAPAGGGGRWGLNARIRHSRSTASRMYMLMRRIVSACGANEMAGWVGRARFICRNVVRHLYTQSSLVQLWVTKLPALPNLWKLNEIFPEISNHYRPFKYSCNQLHLTHILKV